MQERHSKYDLPTLDPREVISLFSTPRLGWQGDGDISPQERKINISFSCGPGCQAHGLMSLGEQSRTPVHTIDALRVGWRVWSAVMEVFSWEDALYSSE